MFYTIFNRVSTPVSLHLEDSVTLDTVLQGWHDNTAKSKPRVSISRNNFHWDF